MRTVPPPASARRSIAPWSVCWKGSRPSAVGGPTTISREEDSAGEEGPARPTAGVPQRAGLAAHHATKTTARRIPRRAAVRTICIAAPLFATSAAHAARNTRQPLRGRSPRPHVEGPAGPPRPAGRSTATLTLRGRCPAVVSPPVAETARGGRL